MPRPMILDKFSDGEIRSALEGADSLREAMRRLGVDMRYSSSYSTVQRNLRNRNIEFDMADFPRKRQIDAAVLRNRTPDSEWFVDGAKRHGPSSKKRLLSLGVKNECSVCGLGPVWNGRPLVLEVDHINGDHLDNRTENLRLICPNCHSQTDTNGPKTQYRYNTCAEDGCDAKIGKTSTWCIAHASKNRKAVGRSKDGSSKELVIYEWPDVESIIELVQRYGYSEASRRLGPSDNAIRAHLRRRGVSPLPRYITKPQRESLGLDW